jgi:hypothetical protein
VREFTSFLLSFEDDLEDSLMEVKDLVLSLRRASSTLPLPTAPHPHPHPPHSTTARQAEP